MTTKCNQTKHISKIINKIGAYGQKKMGKTKINNNQAITRGRSSTCRMQIHRSAHIPIHRPRVVLHSANAVRCMFIVTRFINYV